MLWFLAALLLLPATASIWIVATQPRAQWRPAFARTAILVLLGAFVAGPFLTVRSLGTSEAYNYGLAVADAVTQARSGVFPPLVGQSEFAFNGRIHPVRTAPYLTTFACGLDLVTFRQLNFWALQNLALAFSLMAAAFTTYAALRRCAQAEPPAALTFTAAWLLAPGLLSAAYAMDLYMTVMSAPFVPLVVGAWVRALDGRRGFGTWLLLGASLGLCWWAHPPVALWLSLGTLAAHLPLLLTLRLRWTEIRDLLPAVAIGAALAGYVVVSALSVRSYGSMSAARAPEAVVLEVVQAFPGSIGPISSAANELGDFQLGWLLWGVLALTLLLGLVRRNFTLLVLGGVTLLLLAFTVPVPGLTAWLWERMPTFAITMNGPWPMQRLYLVCAAIVVFAAARGGPLPKPSWLPKVVRDLAMLGVATLSVWTVYQGWRLIERGYSSRRDAEYTAYSHQSENINLTLIAYAMFSLPPTFVNGVMDPMMETRILQRGTAAELTGNLSASAAEAREVMRGTLSAASGSGDIAVLAPRLKLEPGKRYRLDLTFRSPPLKGALRLVGPNTLRVYPLPEAGEPRGFGMKPENRHSLTLWTSEAEPEIVTAELIGSGLGNARLLNFADFTLSTFDPAALPIRIHTWVPFRATVHSPQPGYLEIPRIFLDGYAATVNGQSVRAQRSPDGLVMAAVPAGESQVEIAYPGSVLLRTSFWLSLATLAGVVLGAGAALLRPGFRDWSRRRAAAIRGGLWRAKWLLAGATVALALAGAGWHRWQAYATEAGPLRLKLVLPRGEIGRSQPLLTTGVPGRGTFIFVIYTDATHVQVGIDVWGQAHAWTSPPIEVDYFAEHEFVISSGALLPPGHPKLKGLTTEQQEALRNRITVDLNGRRVLDQPVFSFDSPREAVTVAKNRIQGSSTEPVFVGQVLEAEFLPVTPP